MKKILRIQGDICRGSKVIEALEMLGGINKAPLTGNDPELVYTLCPYTKYIYVTRLDDRAYLTIDDFYKKSQFKVEDFVTHAKTSILGTIVDAKWVASTVYYNVEWCDGTSRWHTASDFQQFKSPKPSISDESIVSLTEVGENTFEVVINDDYEILIKDGRLFVRRASNIND